MKPTLLLISLILLAGCASAAEQITTGQKEYWLGETVQAEVEMEGFSLQKLSLLDNASSKVPVGFLTEKLSDKNFVYFNIPTTLKPGEYSLTAKDKRVANETIQEFEISAKITVLGQHGISIDPAIIFIDPLKDEFKITLKNNANETITVNVTTSEGLKAARSQLQIEPGLTKNAFISHTELQTEQAVTLIYLNRTHRVRIIPPPEKPAEETPAEPQEEQPAPTTGELKFEGPQTVEKTSSRHTSFSDPITIKSTAQKELHNLRFTLTGTLKDIAELKIQTVQTLPAEGNVEQYVWVNKDRNAAPGAYEGDLAVESDEGYSDRIHMKITLQEPQLTEGKPAEKPAENLFNQTRISALLNETQAQEEPSVAKNVTISLVMLFVALIIAALVWRKMRIKTVRETMGEHAKTIRKSHK